MESSPSPISELDDTPSNLNDYKLVPWLNWDEWEFVRVSLFSSSPDSIAMAFRRIATWRSRGCLPLRIEVTAALIEIQQKDPYFNRNLRDGGADSEELLVMLYTMAIVRLVNGTCEKLTNYPKIPGGKRLSIDESAGRIHLPRMLVDIRHEGTHREIPSVHLLRRASTEALNWLKTYYWDLQKAHSPYQHRRSADLRTEIRSKLCELAINLKLKHSSRASTEFKGKCARHREQLVCTTVPVRNKLFSVLLECKSQPSKFVEPKKQIRNTLKNLVRLYSFFSSDVVSVLLDFLLKASNTKDSVDSQDDFQINLSLEVVQVAFDEWKPVITKFSESEPDLLLSLLEAVLDLIQARKICRDDFGSDTFSLSRYDLETQRIGILSSLFTWLVLILRSLKLSPDETQGDQSESDCPITKSTLIELVRSCLRIADPENHELLNSALLMAKLVGSSHLNEKIQKFFLLSSLHSRHHQDYSADGSSEELNKQEKYIRQAVEKLETIKRRKLDSASFQDEEARNTWTIATSWNPCPIGMLPRAVGSSGCPPVLDYVQGNVSKILPPSTENKEHPEHSHCNKRDSRCDVETMDDSSTKRMKMTADSDSAEPDDMNVETVSVSDGIEGRLLIGGVYQKVGDQEMQDILSRIHVLVTSKS